MWQPRHIRSRNFLKSGLIMVEKKTNIYKLGQKKIEEILLDGGYVELEKLEEALHQSQY